MTHAVIGVDGGTSKTIALVADLEGNIIGAARGPGSNWTGTDVEIPMAVVIRTVHQAMEQAQVDQDDVLMGMFTLAGADWPEDHMHRQLTLERAAIAQHVCVKNDTFGGLRAGTSAPYGIVISAGTAANTAVIAPDGREWAFGYYQSYGGALDLSKEAIEAILRAEDGRGEPTILTALVLNHLSFTNLEELLRARIARRIDLTLQLSLCPLVFEAAMEADRVAGEMLVKHGTALAEYATALIRRFDMQQVEFDMVLAGSLFKGKGPLLIETIAQAVHRFAPRARVLRSRFEPAVGAVLLAYDALDLSVGEPVYETLVKTVPDGGFFNTATFDNGSVGYEL